MEKNEKIDVIIKEINDTFNQINEPELNKPYTFEDSTVFFWKCGGFILMDSMVYAFGTDDGWAFLYENPYDYISNEWLSSLTDCINSMKSYLLIINE